MQSSPAEELILLKNICKTGCLQHFVRAIADDDAEEEVDHAGEGDLGVLRGDLAPLGDGGGLHLDLLAVDHPDARIIARKSHLGSQGEDECQERQCDDDRKHDAELGP